jgi:tRNA(Ile)-lysidine synthase
MEERDRPPKLQAAIAALPAGRWVVAVSGGADSVALLHLLHGRKDIQLLVAHLDHQTRAGESTEDARFVTTLCGKLGVAMLLRTRAEMEGRLAELPANVQARYRELRLALFAEAIAGHGAQGVLQAHHADDQAETVLGRLVRGTGIEGLAGIPREATVNGVRILRPLLAIRRQELRDYLAQRQLAWREDSSNRSLQYQRNRLRALLAQRPKLTPPLLHVADTFAALSELLERQAAALPEHFATAQVHDLPMIVQDHLLREWLVERGVPPDDITLRLLEQIRQMAEDSATPAGLVAPGKVHVRRRGGKIFVQDRD